MIVITQSISNYVVVRISQSRLSLDSLTLTSGIVSLPDGRLLSHLLGPHIVAHLNDRVSEAQEKLLLLRGVHLPLRLRLRLLL